MTDLSAALTAEATARRVLGWAAEPGDRSGPPAGQLRRAGELATPAGPTLDALRALTRATGARLGAGAPPFGDPHPIGLGALLLAAAIGGRAQVAAATLLAESVPPGRLDVAGPGTWSDALARHAVAGPFVERPGAPPPPAADQGADDVREPLPEVVLRQSPLTSVLHRPPAAELATEATSAAEAAAAALLARPRGRAVLLGALAGWSPDPLVLQWRTLLLVVLATPGRHPELVADAYLAARVRHGRAWDAALHSARKALINWRAVPDAGSLATARYWLPLADLDRSTPLVRERARLLREARPALDLVRTHRRSFTPVVLT